MSKDNKINETINLYKTVGWKKWFSKWRFAMAPYITVEKVVPKKGKIIELGCEREYLVITLLCHLQKGKL